MARYLIPIQSIPDGDAVPNVSVRVRKQSDDSTITTLVTDDDGFLDWSYDGHPEPFYLHVFDQPGGDKYWYSTDAMTASVLPLKELPVALRVLGDGVIRGYGSALAVALESGGPGISVAPGAANVVGHPVVTYSTLHLDNTRPDSGTRVDRVIVRLYPEGSGTTPGKAEVVILSGTVDAGTPALTQTTTVYEMSLATLTIPAAGTITLTDERTYAGEKTDVSDLVRASSVTTTNASGEALSGLTATLLLPRTATYDVEATVTGRQTHTVGATGWQLQATYGPTFNGQDLSSPSQVAVSPVTGKVAIADYGHGRIVILTSAGAYSDQITSSIADPTGVCYDASGNLYTLGRTGGAQMRLRKYDTSHALTWDALFGSAGGQGHLTTDGTSVWACDSSGRKVYRRNCSDGSANSNFGSSGSTDGKFGSGGPYGIANDGTYLYVGDPGNTRVQKFTVAGVYTDQWFPPGTNTALAVDATGRVFVGLPGITGLYRYTSAGIFVDAVFSATTTPGGVGVASGDVLWVSTAGNTIAKWDEAATPGGYGQVALEIGGVVGTYAGIGQRDGAFAMTDTTTASGPTTLTVRAFGKATANTMTLESAVLSARAVPRS